MRGCRATLERLEDRLAPADLVLPLNFEFSGATPPSGPTPWLTATFTDNNDGTVNLTLDPTNLTGSEFVSRWMFNLDPALDPTALSFTQVAKTGSFADPIIVTGVNAFKADGDGNFDIQFGFATADPGAARSSPEELFVDAVYRKLLDRPAGEIDFGYWVGRLQAGASRAQVVLEIQQSTEHKRNVVRTSYHRLLGRAPDEAGFTFWVGFLDAGHSLDELRANIVASAEYFANRGGGTNAGYLQALYADFLARPPDPASAGFLEALAAGATRLDVARVIITNPEARRVLLNDFYSKHLLRLPGPADRDFALAVLEQFREEHLLANVLASPEHRALATLSGGRFDVGDSVVYRISSLVALTAMSFDFSSVPGGGRGTFQSGAHIQGIGPSASDSGWIGPNPSPPGQGADLEVVKGVTNETPSVGEEVTFTVTVINHGPAAATGVTVADPLPDGLTFVAATPSQGIYARATGVWAVGALASGATAILTITATVDSLGSTTNTATAAGGQPDPNPDNNRDDVTVTPVPPSPPPPPQADLVLSKVVDNPQPFLGSDVTFTLIVNNRGPSTATGVVINDPLPPGLTFVSAAPSQGTYDPNRDLWAVGSLPAGGQATLRLLARVDTLGPVVNTASARAEQADPDLSGNTAIASLTGMRTADIISKRSFLSPAPNGNAAPAALPAETRLPADRSSPEAPFVDAVYQELLNRPAGDLDFGYWVGRLQAGTSRAGVVLEIQQSTEYKRNMVSAQYRRLLGRDADAAGFTFWVGFLDAGHSLDELRANIVASAEYFANRGGGTNAGYLQALYADSLHRAPDPGSAGFLEALAAGATRLDVARVVLTSPEGRRVLLDELYSKHLDRLLGPADEEFALAVLEGYRQEHLLAHLLASPEYQALVRAGFVEEG